MPIYEYACPDCGHNFDVLQKMSDPLVSVCPKCNAENVRKLVSATNFVLKGGGWYKDHYGLKSGDSEGKKDEGAKAEAPKAEGAKAAPATEAPKADSTPAPAPAASPAPAPSTSTATP